MIWEYNLCKQFMFYHFSAIINGNFFVVKI
jgi:hypothetical protein